MPRQDDKTWHSFHLPVLGLWLLECSQQAMRQLKQTHEIPNHSRCCVRYQPRARMTLARAVESLSVFPVEAPGSRSRNKTFPLCSVQNPDSQKSWKVKLLLLSFWKNWCIIDTSNEVLFVHCTDSIFEFHILIMIPPYEWVDGWLMDLS